MGDRTRRVGGEMEENFDATEGERWRMKRRRRRD